MRADRAALETAAVEILRENRVMNLATGTAESLWCVTVFCREEDTLDILCAVEDGSTTMRNLRRNPRVAFTVNRQVPDRFLQGSGTAHVLGPVRQHPKLFAGLTDRAPELEGFVAAVGAVSLVRIVTDRLSVSDLGRGVFPRVTLFRRGEAWLLREEMGALPGLKAWLLALRFWSFPASIMPMLVGGALAYRHGTFDVPLLLLTLLGGLLFHVGANLMNTYFDFRRGVDIAKDADDRTLVDGILPTQHVYGAGIVALALGSAVGGALTFLAGWPVLALGIAGLSLAFFYTAGPVGYKYRALGDVGIFASFGPLLVLGAYYVQTERFDLLPLLFSLPLGLLIDGILHANNFRDTEADRRSGAVTLAQLTGERGAKVLFYFLVLAPYLVVSSLGATVSPWVLLPILTVPAALRLITEVRVAGASSRQALSAVPQRMAQLNLLFGALLAVGIFTSGSL